MFSFVMLGLVSAVLAKILAGKNVSEVTYFVLSGTRSGSLVCCRRAWRNCDVCKNM